MKNSKFFLAITFLTLLFFILPLSSSADTIWCQAGDGCNFGCAGNQEWYSIDCEAGGHCQDSGTFFCPINIDEGEECSNGQAVICDPVSTPTPTPDPTPNPTPTPTPDPTPTLTPSGPPCAVGSVGCCTVSSDCQANPQPGSEAHCCDDGQGTGSHLCASTGGGPYCFSPYGESYYYSQGVYGGYNYSQSYYYSQGVYGPPRPDLIISSGPAPSSPTVKVGDSVNFDASIKNESGVNISNMFNFLYKVDGLSPSGGSLGSLGSGASTGVSSNSWFAQGVGSHHIQICADSTGTVSESNESNNCASRLFQVLPTNYGYGQSSYSVYSYGQGAYSGPSSNPNCSDLVDNDADNWIDFKDLGCLTPLPGSNPPVACGEECTPSKVSQCSDGKDNDKDGNIDGFDSNCRNALDNTEKFILFIEF